jgi:hypothetical protein
MVSELKSKKTTESKNSKEIKLLEAYYLKTGESIANLRPGDMFDGVDIGEVLRRLRKKYYGIMRGTKLRDEQVARLEKIGLKEGDVDYWATERIKIIILNAYSRKYGHLVTVKPEQICDYNKRKCPVGEWLQEILTKYDYNLEELKRRGLKLPELHKDSELSI